MARMNISVPDDLKDRMDTFPTVNWSQVAREAFMNAILIEEAKEFGAQEAGIARLRISRSQDHKAMYSLGYQLGLEVALNEAEYGEIKAVLGAARYFSDNSLDFNARSLIKHVEDDTDVEYCFEGLPDGKEALDGFLSAFGEVLSKVDSDR